MQWDGRILSDEQLLYTKTGRRWLERWCDPTTLKGNAEEWRDRLNYARKLAPDDECLEA
jgi:hypothetical protein